MIDASIDIWNPGITCPPEGRGLTRASEIQTEHELDLPGRLMERDQRGEILPSRIFAWSWMIFGSRPTNPSITGLCRARTPGQEERGTGSALAALSDGVSEATD
jgi:hypothetical protein